VTQGRRAPQFVARAATEKDGDSLGAFTCATGPWFEREVESYARKHALRRVMATPSTYRLLVLHEDERLVACAAHHPEVLLREDATGILATRLQLLAIATTDQGRRLEDGTRLSDTVMQTLIADAIETRGTPVLTGIVAQENVRSMACCERNGLRSQVAYDDLHVRLSGHFARR